MMSNSRGKGKKYIVRQIISQEEAESKLTRDYLQSNHLRKIRQVLGDNGSYKHTFECNFTDCPKIHTVSFDLSNYFCCETDNMHNHTATDSKYPPNNFADAIKLIKQGAEGGIKESKHVQKLLELHDINLDLVQVS